MPRHQNSSFHLEKVLKN